MPNEDFGMPVTEFYNQHLQGFFGEFGSGANSQIHFIQTIFKPEELQKITLISDIPGSEAWEVRDLFQRDVDKKRVTKSILPYLQDPEKVKFFNPLTLTLLPMDKNTNQILTDMPIVEETEVEENGVLWKVLEVEPFYRFKYISSRNNFGVLSWNESIVKLVAIDGQHRLSALKRFEKDVSHNEDIRRYKQWSIPAVVFGLKILDPEGYRNSILDVIRNIFIYINTEARQPSPARRILLNDESINNIASQELLQYSHSNDLIDDAHNRDTSIIPLLFYDWRGHEDEGKPIPSPASIRPIEEINAWLHHYILGEDFSDEQQQALGIDPTSDFYEIFTDARLHPQHINSIRQHLKSDLLPGLSFLLRNFVPFKKYTDAIYVLEKEYNAKSDLARHAFYQLKYGNNTAGEAEQSEIDKIYEDLISELVELKRQLPPLIADDIGTRAVIFSYSYLKDYYDKHKNHSTSWIDYAGWFIPAINKVFESRWFVKTRAGQEIDRMRLHITHDHSDGVVNYKLESVPDSFGSLISILVAAQLAELDKSFDSSLFNEIWEDCTDTLYNTLIRGYRRQVRAKFKEDGKYFDNPDTFKKELNKMAIDRTRNHIEYLKDYLGV